METGGVKCSAVLSGQDDVADGLPATLWLANFRLSLRDEARASQRRGERGRETLFNATTQLHARRNESGGERAALQTLRPIRGRPVGAKRLEGARLSPV